MSKPTLTREQSDALTKLIEIHSEEGVLRIHITGTGGWLREYSSLNSIDTLTMAAAITNGWETEKTPIDALRELYDFRKAKRSDSYNDGYCEGINTALRLTGQVIEGINA